jgi:hypothetical protein
MAWFPIPCSFGRASYLTQFLRWLAHALYDVISVTYVKLHVLANTTKSLNWWKGLIQSTYTLQYLHSSCDRKDKSTLAKIERYAQEAFVRDPMT